MRYFDDKAVDPPKRREEMMQKNPRFSVNPEFEKTLLSIITTNDNEPMHYELLGELARTRHRSDMTNKGALWTLSKSMRFKCERPGFYCLAGTW